MDDYCVSGHPNREKFEIIVRTKSIRFPKVALLTRGVGLGLEFFVESTSNLLMISSSLLELMSIRFRLFSLLWPRAGALVEAGAGAAEKNSANSSGDWGGTGGF